VTRASVRPAPPQIVEGGGSHATKHRAGRAEELGTAYADGCEAPPRAKRALRNF
jgi:hypothetical protein